MSSLQEQASAHRPHPHVAVHFRLCSPAADRLLPSTPIQPRYHVPEQEIALGTLFPVPHPTAPYPAPRAPRVPNLSSPTATWISANRHSFPHLHFLSPHKRPPTESNKKRPSPGTTPSPGQTRRHVVTKGGSRRVGTQARRPSLGGFAVVLPSPGLPTLFPLHFSPGEREREGGSAKRPTTCS